MQGVVDDRSDRGIGETERATGARGILFDARESEPVESVPPEGAGVALGPQLLRNLLVLGTLGRTQHNLGAEDEAVRGGTATGPALESLALLRGQGERRSNAHRAR